MAGIRPVVAVYSTFFSRAFDQANLDVGLHGSPVVFVLDRAGITGDDGPSHHGMLDMALALSIPGMTVFAPSAAEEVGPMLRTALELPGPSTIRFPKTAPRHVGESEVGSGLAARKVRSGDGSVCLLGVGKLVAACIEAADRAGRQKVSPQRCGTCGSWRRLTPTCSPTPAVMPSWSPPRTACGTAAPAPSSSTPWRSPSKRRAGPARRPGSSGSRAQYIAQGKADDILDSLGLNGSGIAESVRRARQSVPARQRQRADPPLRAGWPRCARTKSLTA